MRLTKTVCTMGPARSERETMRRIRLLRGVIQVEIEPYGNLDDMFERGEEIALTMGLVKDGDNVISAAGFTPGRTGGTDMLRTRTVSGRALERRIAQAAGGSP